MAESRTPVTEPVLPMADIQGIVVPGFFKPHQILLGVVCASDPDSIREFKAFLGETVKEIATADVTLKDRRRHRMERARKVTKDKGHSGEASIAPDGAPLIAVGFSYPGLLKLTPGASAISSEAFRLGLAARSAFLGDPAKPTDEGHPTKWKVGGPGNGIDALFVVAGDTADAVSDRAQALVAKLAAAGLTVTYQETGSVRDDMPGHEHFGFNDGISQPGIRGRASAAAEDFVTNRHIAPGTEPDRSLFGYPGQDLVWPGVFVLGQPATSPDPLIPGPPTSAGPDWTRNGSFLVFRRLRQDVGLFWRTMKAEAARLAALPGFEGLTDDALAARLVGRWPSGAPINRVPAGDNEDLGVDPFANNSIRFDSDTTGLPLEGGHKDSYPLAKADPVGVTCPWAAHIRKVNTRDSGTDTGGRDSTYARRLLRVGVPFGQPLKDRYAEVKDDPHHGNRGLLFLSIQASLENQFEFLMTRWMGDPVRPKMPGGHDIVVGQNHAPGEDRVRRCTVFGLGVREAVVSTNAQWIVPTGGGYFFVPSVTALADVIAN